MKPSTMAVLVGVAMLPSIAFAQDGRHVLLLINATSVVSERIGTHYSRTRDVPPHHMLRLQTEAVEEITRTQFEEDIERPVSEWLTRQTAQDRILYIVLTKGMPLRIRGTAGRAGTTSSVDSELALLYRKLAGTPSQVAGPVRNPYFLESGRLTEARTFSHAEHDIYLVTRLDGFSEADALALIDRGAAATSSGNFLLDSSGVSAKHIADRWLRTAADRLSAAGYRDRLVFDSTSDVLTDRTNVLGYSSSLSNASASRSRRLGLGFVNGALATLFVGADARTLEEPPADWNPQVRGGQNAVFKGSSQSLSGDLIREGITGVAGQVAEPFLDGAIRPDVLFPAYASGFNLVEAFYLAMPYLSWQTIVFGDPLCSPFRSTVPTTAYEAPPLDARTDLPEQFLRRRLAAMTATGIDAQAAALMLESEARRKRGDTAGMREALESATTVDPGSNAAHLMLATAYEKAGEYDLAIDRYRRVLVQSPGDPVAANNLAYALAAYKDLPKEALPIAEVAYAASKGEARIADTLGWIHHLLGNAAQAEALISQAAVAAPHNADIQLHLAHVHASMGRRDRALAALARSLQLDATFANRDDVKALQADLGR